MNIAEPTSDEALLTCVLFFASQSSVSEMRKTMLYARVIGVAYSWQSKCPMYMHIKYINVCERKIFSFPATHTCRRRRQFGCVC